MDPIGSTLDWTGLSQHVGLSYGTWYGHRDIYLLIYFCGYGTMVHVQCVNKTLDAYD